MDGFMKKNVGFISFRLSGTDGVSLETKKWVDVLERNGCACYFYGGELDTPPEVSFQVPEAHFQHPEIRELYAQCFSGSRRPPSLTSGLHKYREILKKSLYEFVEKFSIDILIPENAVTIPLNISLGMAITEFIAETGFFTIAHHHDFFWERKRFLRNCVWDYLNQCYPPHLNTIQHVVINTSAANQLALRTGISSTLIPNVMEFENSAPGIDDYNAVGDCAVEVPGFETPIAPNSNLIDFYIAHRLEIETVRQCVARGVEPPVWRSANAPGGDEFNTKFVEKYLPRVKML